MLSLIRILEKEVTSGHRREIPLFSANTQPRKLYDISLSICLSSPDVLTTRERHYYLSEDTKLQKTGLVFWVGLRFLVSGFPQEKYMCSISCSLSRTEWARNNAYSFRRQSERMNLDLSKTKTPLTIQGHRAGCFWKMTHSQMDEATDMAMSSPWSYN